jgi:hypothetical protein
LEVLPVAKSGFSCGAVFCVLVIGFGGCSESQAPPKPEILEGPTPRQTVVTAPIPLFYDTELLRNGTFNRKPSDRYFGWEVNPSIQHVKSARGMGDGDLAVDLLGSGGETTLVQKIKIHKSVARYTLSATCLVKSSSPDSARLAVDFNVVGQEQQVWRDNTGGGDWETVQLETLIPIGTDLKDVAISIKRRQGAEKGVLIDKVSVMMVKSGRPASKGG